MSAVFKNAILLVTICVLMATNALASDLELRLNLVNSEKITTPLDLVQYERFKNQPYEENSVAREPLLTKKDIVNAYVLKKDGLRIGIIDLVLKPEASTKMKGLMQKYAHREAFWMSDGKIIATYNFDKPIEKNIVTVICRFMKSPDTAIQFVKDLGIPFEIKDPSMGDYEKPEKVVESPYVPPPYELPTDEAATETKKTKRSGVLVG